MCAARPRARRAHELAPLILVGIVAVDVVVKVGLFVVAKEFTSDGPQVVSAWTWRQSRVRAPRRWALD